MTTDPTRGDAMTVPLPAVIGLLPDCDHPTSRGVCPDCIAAAVLASPWLADLLAATAAQAHTESNEGLRADVELLLAKYAGRSKWVGYERPRREAWAEIEEREALRGLGQGQVPAVVERIVAARVAAARAEALQLVREGLTRGMHLHHDGDAWVSLPYVLDLLDRAVVSREPGDTA